MLALAGVDPGDAVLATFAYRLVSYWLTLPFGLLGVAIAPRNPQDTEAAGPVGPARLVGDPGLEPGTSSLSEKRSNRLS
jgi:hypothetical protein